MEQYSANLGKNAWPLGLAICLDQRQPRAIVGSMDDRPVGIFDSGVGGLSVYRAFRAKGQNEDVVYFADTAFFPYGPRPAGEVRERCFVITRSLIERDVKLIVAACNTASAAAIADLRKSFDVPFVAMVPGVKPATSQSRSGRVTILATPGTLDGDLYARVIEEFGHVSRITAVPGDGLAELVEEGAVDTDRSRDAVYEVLRHEVEAGTDTVVLGCTHYCFLSDVIQAVFPGVTLVDTSDAVARRALMVLKERDACASRSEPGSLQLMVTGKQEAFVDAMQRLGFGETIREPILNPGFN
jgi:glutamate racemase